MDVTFFKTPEDFRKWLSKNHDKLTEQWVGFYKKASKLPSISWAESVDEALCYGWIDGLRKTIDDISYKIRFTPRKTTSHWSAINLKRMEALIKEGRMQPAGLEIYRQRDQKKIDRYSYELANPKLDKKYEAAIKADQAAWSFYQSLPASAKKQTIWWVMSAKQEATRLRRLETLIQCAADGLRIPHIRRNNK